MQFATPDLTGNELKYVTECIETGWVTHAGRFEAEFEKAMSERLKTPCLATSSGTGALHLALLSLGIGPGDEVIIPNLTFSATASVVLAVGATPVMLDIDLETWGLDRKRIFMSLCKKTQAIIPVHLYGEDAGEFKQFGVPVIEDACESFGIVPLRGDITCYSFYGNKVITTGEGGMICGNYGNAQDWRDGGFDHNYRNTIPGLNYRMTNMQAALGLAQLERANDLVAKRLANAEKYQSRLKGKGKWLFVAEVENAVHTIAKLKENGIEARPVFNPLHLSPAFKKYKKGRYLNSVHVWQHGVVLPTGSHITDNDIDKICELICHS